MIPLRLMARGMTWVREVGKEGGREGGGEGGSVFEMSMQQQARERRSSNAHLLPSLPPFPPLPQARNIVVASTTPPRSKRRWPRRARLGKRMKAGREGGREGRREGGMVGSYKVLHTTTGWKHQENTTSPS